MDNKDRNTNKTETAGIISSLKFLLVCVWVLSLLFIGLDRYNLGLKLWMVFTPVSFIVAAISGLQQQGHIKILPCILSFFIPFGFVNSGNQEQ